MIGLHCVRAMVEERGMVAMGSGGAEDGAEDLAPAPAKPKVEFEGFQLPFRVATICDIEQRAYITTDGTPEWLWARTHAFCGITTDPGRLLRNNTSTISRTLDDLQVPASEFHYRGVDTAKDEGEANPATGGPTWKDHTFESRALLVALLWIMKNKALQAQNKVKALTLLLSLVTKAFTIADVQRPIMGLILKPDGTLASQELVFSSQGLCQSWGQLLSHCPSAVVLWKRLGLRCWLNKCIASSQENASLSDIWLFMAYIVRHPKLKILGQNLWLCFAKIFLPELLFRTGTWLMEYAIQLADDGLQMLPMLRRKTGNIRKIADPVSKMLLLFKLRREKQHRQRVARTHSELGGATNRMMVFETYLDSLLHQQALQKGFEGVNQVSLCWDPSSYGGKDVLISVVYAPSIDKAAYLLSQQLSQTMLSELSEDLLPLARERKLVRLEGFKEMKGVSAALNSIGLSLHSFAVPKGLCCRPLERTEYRLEGANGMHYIMDDKTKEMKPEIPPDMDLAKVACLVSISDQGPNVIASINYLQYHPQNSIMCLALFDPFHRGWNDLKLALKRGVSGLWRTVLELTVVANLNYGPFGSGNWFWKKKAKLQDFLMSEGIDSSIWKTYQHHICVEQRRQEPRTVEETQELFDELATMDSFTTKGPLIKLMRWFSWFESMAFCHGELIATKMILEHSSQVGGEKSGEEVDEAPKGNIKDDAEQLRELKKRKGSWKLAPQLITNKNLANKDIIMAVGKASWSLFASRAKEIVSPVHVLEFNISAAAQKFWCHEIVEMIDKSLHNEQNLQHLLPEWRVMDDVLVWHTDFFEKLVEQRVHSLTSFYLLPPMCYAHLLAPSPQIARQAHALALKHWRVLLAAEGAKNEGMDLQALQTMHWRHSPFIRTILLAFEQDEHRRLFFTSESASMRLMQVVAKNLGDSRLVENIHQFGKDLFRESKSNTVTNTAIMSNALRSKVLEGRKVQCINAEVVQKALGPQWNCKHKGGIVRSLKTAGKALPPTLQHLMKPKSKIHTWPSPSPASLFQSVASSQWVFEYWEHKKKYEDQGINSAWLTCLAKPGSILAQRSTGLLVKVLASSEFSFIGITMDVQKNLQGQTYYLAPPNRDCILWHHIFDLSDWLVLQCKPVLVNGSLGPVGWVNEGSPLSLEAAALISGQTLTYKQMLALAKRFGLQVKGNTPKNTVHEILIGELVPEGFQAEARAHIQAKKEEDIDTDFSEVVSELGHEEGNQQDIKEYQEKKRHRKLKTKLAAKDKPVSAKPKRKPKGKAKPKAQGKHSKTLLGTLLKRTLKLRQEQLQEEKEMAAQEMDVDDEEAPEPERDVGMGGEPGAPSLAMPGGGSSEVGEGLPSSSSKGPVASEVFEGEPSSSSKRPVASEVGEGEPSHKRPRAPKQKSPQEIMALLQPPGCTMGLSFQDHRFTSTWRNEHKELPGEFGQLSFTRNFAKRRTWEEALVLVHSHSWAKWGLLKAQYPLSPGQGEQIGGVIPQDVLDQLKVIVATLKPAVRYGQRGRSD